MGRQWGGHWLRPSPPLLEDIFELPAFGPISEKFEVRKDAKSVPTNWPKEAIGRNALKIWAFFTPIPHKIG
jgi:hypothetical protein